MTVSSTLNRVNQDGNGATTAFPVSFPFQAQADLIVLSTVIATGVQTTKTLTTHYTISGTPNALGHYNNGGTVNFITAPASTERITIYRDPARTQSLDLTENNSLPAESTEASIDYQTMLIQRVSDLIGRSLRQPDGDSANLTVIPSKVSRASLVLGFDADGNPIAVAVTGSVGTALPITGGTLTGNLTISTTSEPLLRINTSHATNFTTQIQFLYAGSTKWLIANDLDQLGTNILTIYDSVNAAVRLQISATGVVTANGGTLSINASQAEVNAGTVVKAITADLNPTTLLTPQASTSGTSIDFTGIPSGTRTVAIMFNGVSTNNTSGLRIQIGDAGGIEVAGYAGAVGNPAGEVVWSGGSGADLTSGTVAAGVYSGVVSLTLIDSATNAWAISGMLARTDTAALWYTTGAKALSAVLDRVRITTIGGADTFDAGQINVNYTR